MSQPSLRKPSSRRRLQRPRCKCEYEPAKFNVDSSLSDSLPAEGQPGGPRVMSHRGDTDAAFASAPVKVDETYITPVETHNPMEMHATVAVWDGKKYTLYESSQGVMNHQNVLAQVLGEPKENVEVISRFIGSGFGGKLFPWPHSAIAAAASRKLNRPVKLTLSRKMMFTNSGHRPNTQQRMRLGATPDGKLVSLQQDYRNHTSYGDDIRENCGEATPFLYSTANLKVTSALVRRNVGTPTPMRGPGAVPGLFALESAMDELAIKLKKDPVELRLSLDTLTDEEKQQAVLVAAPQRMSAGGRGEVWLVAPHARGRLDAQRRPDPWLGCGRRIVGRQSRRLRGDRSSLRADGTARVSCGTQDIGTGTYTVIAQIVSDKTGIPVDKIDVVLGRQLAAARPYLRRLHRDVLPFLPAVDRRRERGGKSGSHGCIQHQRLAISRQGRPDSLTMTAGRVHAKGESAGERRALSGDTAHGEPGQRQWRRKERRPGSRSADRTITRLTPLAHSLWRSSGTLASPGCVSAGW